MIELRHEDHQQPYLSLRNIDRFFGITKALQKVNMDIYAGEVIGLVGANGAGKSTLMKILTGVLNRTDGEIICCGAKQESYNAKIAKSIGVSCAYQDLSLCTNLSVFENFALLNVSHRMTPDSAWRSRARKETEELIERYFPGNGIDVSRTVGSLSLTDMQVVEICKTLMTDNLKILILDEPTSALSSDKAGQLHSVVKELSAKGVAVIYISHKLEEIRRVSDRIVILSNGTNAGEFYSDEITQEELVSLMGGNAGSREREGRDLSQNEEVLNITDLKTEVLKGVSISLKKGEIIGISGLAGAGQQELLQEIFRAGKKKNPNIIIQGSISYVSGNREKEGVFPFWDIAKNILVANFNYVKDKLLINKNKVREEAQRWYDKLKFRAEGIESNIMALSGGNQQKALIARGVASGADIILLNDPTAGVDIGTKQDIYKLLEEVRDMGKAIILYSTEDAEMEICDRVYILRDGQITKELQHSDITVSNIVAASFIETEKSPVIREKKDAVFKIFSEPWLLPLVTLILIFAANTAINPNLMTYTGLRMKIGSALPLIFAALGQMFIVMCGDVDMGNGYSIGLANVIAGTWLTGSPVLGMLGLLVFIGCYVAMSALIKLRQIPAIVVTMGAQFVWYGLALIICPTPGGSCPAWISAFFKLKTPIIPFPILLALIAGALSWGFLYRCRYGMVLRGSGNNIMSVERSGWSHFTAKLVAYGISGLFVVLAGLAYTSVCNGADANSSVNYNMMSIATVILGGCEMAGGVPVPFGVVMAAIVMNLINSLLTAMKVNSNYQTAIIGLILIGVLAMKFMIHKGKGARS